MASLKGRLLQPAAKTQQQRSQYQCQHQGNSLKITSYVGLWGKILIWIILGFQDKALLREMFQLQFWLCNNKSNSHWDEGHTRHMTSANKPGKALLPLTPSQPSACQPMPLTQPRLSHLSFGGAGGPLRGRWHWEFDRMTEDLVHRSGGACVGEGQVGRSMQLVRKELKEVGRGTSNSGSKPLGLPAAFCASSVLLTLLYRATSPFGQGQGHWLVRTLSPVPLDEAKKAPDHTDILFVEKVCTIRID